MIEVMTRVGTDKENLRIRLPALLKEAWDATLARKKITQQAALEGLIDFVVNEENDVVQSMMLGQTRPTPELMAALLKSISERKPQKKAAKPHGFIPDR